MFESVIEDKAARGLEKAARLFYVVTFFNALSLSYALYKFFSGSFVYRPRQIAFIAVSLVLAFVAARAIERGRKWGMWLGLAVAISMLIQIPVGTVVGTAAIVYLIRATRGGLFA